MKRRKRSRLQDLRIMNELLPAAEKIALAEGLEAPGAEHLILAAIDLPEGSARRVFEQLGREPGDFARAIEQQHDAALQDVGASIDEHGIESRLPPPPEKPRGVYRSQPSAQQLFRRVVKRVRQERSQLYGAYFLLEAAALEHGVVARALDAMGIDREALARTARAELDVLNQADG